MSKMGDFDLKTALSLFPSVEGSEEQIKKLIDSLEFYSESIKTSEHSKLMKFVMKTRLSSSIRVKLNESYDTIVALIEDIRKYLLPRHSDAAIMSRLVRCKQGNRTLEEFGKEIEKLSVDLTIAQAEGKKLLYQELRTINERMAIKKFADGLNSKKLSTIIASRGVSTIRQAVVIAKEEEEEEPSEISISYARILKKKFVQRPNQQGYRNFYNSNRNNNWQNRQGRPANWQNQQGQARPWFNNNQKVGQLQNKSANVRYLESAEQPGSNTSRNAVVISEMASNSGEEFFRDLSV